MSLKTKQNTMKKIEKLRNELSSAYDHINQILDLCEEILNVSDTSVKTTSATKKRPVKKATRKPVSSYKDEDYDDDFEEEDLEEDLEIEEDEDEDEFRPTNKLKSRKSKVFGGGKNLFVDDGTLAKGKQFKTPKKKLTPRSRPKYKPKYKKCKECNKPFKIVIGAGGISESKCNKCITGR